MIKNRANGKSRPPRNATSVADAVAGTKARRRRRLLLANLLLGSLWQLTRIIVDLGNDGIGAPVALTSMLLPVQMLALVGWTLALLALGALIRKEGNGEVGEPEPVSSGNRRQLWQAAVKAGFFSMLIVQLALLIIAPDTRISAVTGADITIYTGAVSAVGTFLFLSAG